MNRILSAVVLASVLAGCAARSSPQLVAFNQYKEANQPLMRSGQILASQYYVGLYDAALLANAPSYFIWNTSKIIDAARQMEAGTISKEAFEQIRRELSASNVAGHEALVAQAQEDSRRQQALGMQQMATGLALMQAGQPQPYVARAPQPAYSPTAGSTLKSSVYSNGLRYCNYYNGVVHTVSNSQNCPNTSP